MAKVVDVQLFDGNIADAVETILNICARREKQNRLVSATGAHGIVTAHRNPGFRRILECFFMNLADGMPGVWVSRLKGDKRIKRCYGPDFLEALMVASRDRQVRHYLCGGKEGVAQELQQVCENRFGNPNVVGTSSPPFRAMTDEELMRLAEDINARNVDIVWIGLSTPRQEEFAFRLACYTQVDFLCTVGAAFDFHTGRLKQAPPWIRGMGLEWAFRLLVEPRRLWKRYLAIVPLFLFYNVVDLFRYMAHLDREADPT